MSCKICGQNNCVASFHSLEEQQAHDEVYGRYEDEIDTLKDRVRELEQEVEDLENDIRTRDSGA